METTAVKERPVIFSGSMVRAILAGQKTVTRQVMKPQPRGDHNGLVWGRNIDSEVGWSYRTEHCGEPHPDWLVECPYGQTGERLWVRETWTPIPAMKPSGYFTDPKWINRTCWYAADNDRPMWGGKWRPSIHMLRASSRLVLELTGVRVERLQEITEADARKEGFKATKSEQWWQGYREVEGAGLVHQRYRGDEPPEWMIEPKMIDSFDPLASTALQQFSCLWNQLNGPRGFCWDSNPWVWVVEFKRIEEKA